MKIICDKIQSGDQHSLTRVNVKALVSLLPEECRSRIKTVHLSNQVFSRHTFDRPVICDSFGRLTILSRGFEEIVIIREILIELAQSGILDPNSENTLHWALYANHLKKKDYQFFERRIEPYLRGYEETDRPNKWEVYD